MAWHTAARHRFPGPGEDASWSAEETAVLADAVSRAPSVHNTQPWSLRVEGRRAVLEQRDEAPLREHDPHGRDARLSCGAAVANLAIAVRALGWSPEIRWRPSAASTATVTARGRQPVTPLDRERLRALARRSSHRRAFAARPVPALTRTAVLAAATAPVAWLEGRETAREVAELLGYAARVHRDDAGYQRELAEWTGRSRDAGLAPGALAASGAPAAGLAGPAARVPDEHRLAERLSAELVLVFGAGGDGPREQLQVGESAERAWVEATRLGLVGSVMTQPLRLPEVRSGVRAALGMSGEPHLVLRLGYPAADGVPRSGKRPLPDVLTD
ncbi:Acg family FMN-binding oxidoreductase [Saccharopolyspora sp. CA-218241]|uniref:Acg family FMN-binding oxidoreductase n=1 Tax=Saccharopolyspora sp. CA-218241 TaxID=3240027 RepID=UPI003D9747E3